MDHHPQHEDLKRARAYMEQSLSFTPAARRRALRYLGRAIRKAGRYTSVEFLVLVARLAAFADNGHDYFDSGTGWWPPTRLPLWTQAFTDGLVIARATPEWAPLLGARVVAIDGLELDQLRRRLQTYFGGPAPYLKWCATWAIETGGVLHAMGLASRSDQLELTVALPGGRRIRRAVPFAASPAGTSTLVRVNPEPLYLQEPDRLFRMARMAPWDALYLQFRAHSGTADQPMEPFLRQVEAELRQAPPAHLVLDLRFDSGGNSDLTVELVGLMAATVPGKVYVLIGQRTFSAGIVTAALVRRRAGQRAVLVGEPVGDRLRWWSEGRTIPLPYSGYGLHLCDGLWDLEHGCAGEAGCYGDRFDVTVGSLDPNLPAPLTTQAWIKGRDPGLEAVVRDLGEP